MGADEVSLITLLKSSEIVAIAPTILNILNSDNCPILRKGFFYNCMIKCTGIKIVLILIIYHSKKKFILRVAIITVCISLDLVKIVTNIFAFFTNLYSICTTCFWYQYIGLIGFKF